MTSLAGPGGPLYAYLAEEVLGTESPEVVALLRAVAPLDRFSRDLCEALGLADPGGALAALARKGLFVERTGDGDDWFRMNALVRDFVLKRLPLDPEEIRDLRLRAAVWLEANGHLDDAARSLQEAGDADELARFLGDRGSVLVDAGLVRRVVELADAIPPELRTAEVEITVGQARAAQGEWEEALASFRRAAGDAPELPPGLAWRMGFIHYFRGQPDEAMRAYARGRVDTGTTADEALLLAWTAALRWMEGDVDRCREDAELAHRAAMASGDLRALAAARTTLAMLAASAGDRRANDAHYLEALDAAERAGDLFQVVRIRTNRASHLYEEGWYEQAREELDLAIRLGEVAGFAPHLALALNNRGATWYHQGELELAVADFERSRALYQRMDSRRIAYPLTGLGNVYRERGELSLARASYEEAVRQAEPAKDLQGLVPALAGLARVIAVDDPAGARRMSQRAVDLGTGLGYVSALLAGGWVAFGDGDQKEGFDLGEQAAASARERRDRAGLAEALELQALATPDGPDAGLLEEAREIWRTLGNALAEARVELVLARFDHESLASQDTQSWVRRLEALGVRPGARAAAGPLAVLPMAGQASVGVSALGAFQVIRRGQPVPRAEWQSKKARALLKMLVARRGRPVHREALMEALWPDEDPELLANRLSVALTGVRTILDPDRQRAPEHYVTADRDTVALNRGHLDIDVERFLRSARTALDLVREGRVEEAVPALETAEAAYTGEFLEEDAYDDWAAPLREEARAAFVAVARALARAAAAREDHDSAIRYFLRLLERDPYDEGAHLGVVATAERARRHGEARRFYGVYVARMEEIDVEPAPFPALTGD
jgi:DNA-binding SARP family transcriptional activator